MLRLFRYEGWDAKVVAEPHSDLGLLSVVVGNVPGLEVWDGHAWFDVEREMQRAEMQGASLLVGRQLERLSNGRYSAGGHRVVSYGAAKPAETQDAEKRYRFSIVFVLRAHEPVVINSDELETEVTGKWDEPLKGTTAGKMYDEIRGRHYNINIGVEEREKQRRNVEMRKVG
jgi:isopenicillin N synthase-like dioxygenase